MVNKEISEYEKHRLTRITENKARLEALGLPHLAASSLIGSSSKPQRKVRGVTKRKDKRGVGAGNEEDEEYRPSDDDEGAEEDSGDECCVDSEEEEEYTSTSSASRRKGKKGSSLIAAKAKRISNSMKGLDADFKDDGAALMQAISLSLGATTCNAARASVGAFQKSAANMVRENAQGNIYKSKAQQSVGRKKSRKLTKARVQLTEDEVVAFFFTFDAAGKGYITPRDVKKMATTHDFCWADIEIERMIHSFDGDGDGKLSLEDFRSIVSRCKMLQETEET